MKSGGENMKFNIGDVVKVKNTNIVASIIVRDFTDKTYQIKVGNFCQVGWYKENELVKA